MIFEVKRLEIDPFEVRWSLYSYRTHGVNSCCLKLGIWSFLTFLKSMKVFDYLRIFINMIEIHDTRYSWRNVIWGRLTRHLKAETWHFPMKKFWSTLGQQVLPKFWIWGLRTKIHAKFYSYIHKYDKRSTGVDPPLTKFFWSKNIHLRLLDAVSHVLIWHLVMKIFLIKVKNTFSKMCTFWRQHWIWLIQCNSKRKVLYFRSLSVNITSRAPKNTLPTFQLHIFS